MIESFNSVIRLLVETQILIFIIILVSYVIEIITGFKLLIDHFMWRKSPKNAVIASDFHSGLYFIFSFIYLVYKSYNKAIELNLLTITTWSVIVIILTLEVRKIYSKYQRVDYKKADDDYS